MGMKLNRLLGRGLKVTKFKPTLSLALSRISVLKNQRTVRCTQARSDVVQLLQQGHQDRALLRVEQVIKEQNMVDAYSMMESYINLLFERADLMENQKECPEEVKEAVSTLCFASSRCGEFPELQEIRAAFQSHYGKEFVARAVELRNNCGVNTKMIQKMSTILPALEVRTTLLKHIADDNNITLLHLHQEGGLGNAFVSGSGDGDDDAIENEDSSSNSLKTRRQKYNDVADAAQAAFEGAEYAAAAARAAVELSRMGGSHTPGAAGSRRTNPFGSKDEPAPGLKKKTEESHNKLRGTKSSSSKEEEEEENGEVMSLQTDEIRHNQPGGAGLNVEPDKEGGPPRLNIDKPPFSMRTRQLRGY